ncbi:hypothetical protein [Nocardia mexicana]|uniref:hypothetical protein n=1 Tax=Nocardia mexicana TaxID=279262 RepID=UPI0012F48D7D|nr:hypothetical protein [Nocardia mexicana]
MERGDLALAGMAVKVIRGAAARTRAAQIVVNGFPYLPLPCGEHHGRTGRDVLTDVADTLDVLSEVTERLEEYGERVHLMPFGWVGSYRIDSVGGTDATRTIVLPTRGTGRTLTLADRLRGGRRSSLRQPYLRTPCTKTI